MHRLLVVSFYVNLLFTANDIDPQEVFDSSEGSISKIFGLEKHLFISSCYILLRFTQFCQSKF